MKKLFMTVLMAFLVGGFAITANAQDVKNVAKSKANKEVKKADTSKNEVSKVADVGAMLKEYEQAINLCVKAYKGSIAGEKTAEKSTNDYEKCLKQALKIKDQLTKLKDKMTPEQVDLFTKLSDDLAKVNVIK